MKEIKFNYLTLPASERLALVSNLLTMLTAGISMLHAVDSLSKNKKGNQAVILKVVRDDLLQGKPLSVSFAKFPRVFNRVTVNMLRAAEEAGTLDSVLKDLKAQIKKDIEFKNKIRAALLYPLSVLLIFIAVVPVIFIVVIPRVASVFLNLKVSLPLPTKIMFLISNILIYQTWLVILLLLLCATGAAVVYKYQREKIMDLIYSLPVVSGLVHEIDLMQFTRSMHLLLTSGITITVALELAGDIVRKKQIATGITSARHAVMKGNPISSAFKECGRVFPEIMITLVETGEKTGSLDRTMIDISEYFDDRVSDSLKTVVTVLEPVMLVIVGLLVGGMMLAIMGPIYGLIGQITH